MNKKDGSSQRPKATQRLKPRSLAEKLDAELSKQLIREREWLYPDHPLGADASQIIHSLEKFIQKKGSCSK